MKEKKCTKCGEVKPLSGFYKHKQCKDGHRPDCKDCYNERINKTRSENREEYNAKQRQWRNDKIEQRRESERRYYHKNKDTYKIHNKKYYESNKDRILETQKEYRLNNRDKFRKYSASYAQKNKVIIDKKRQELNGFLRSIHNDDYYKALENSNTSKNCKECDVHLHISLFYKNRTSADGYDVICKECRDSKNKKWRECNPEALFVSRKKYYENNNHIQQPKRVQWDKENRERSNKRKRDSYWRNIENSRRIAREWRVKKRKSCHLHSLKESVRTRLSYAFKSNGYEKNSNASKLLGASWEVVKRHIERQFTNGMTWDNYGEWHIDHIIPLATAKTEAELIRLCHYRNLQPLWAKDNLSKGAKIIEPVQTYLPL